MERRGHIVHHPQFTAYGRERSPTLVQNNQLCVLCPPTQQYIINIILTNAQCTGSTKFRI
jgi:hypothetical protein